MSDTFTPSPGQLSRWTRLLSDNPARVVRALSLKPTESRTPSDGDTHEDKYACLSVLNKLTESQNTSSTWDAFIEQGGAEALCMQVSELASYSSLVPEGRLSYETVKNDLASSYYLPLQILCQATIRFNDPPSEADLRCINALKMYWPRITGRLWEEPENTLRRDAAHVKERVVFAQLVARLLFTDSSFLSLVFDADDLTIPVLSRQWAHSTSTGDVYATGSLLLVLFDYNHPRFVSYYESNPRPPRPIVLSRVYHGIKASATQQEQAKILASVFALHLAVLDPEASAIETDLCFQLQQDSDAHFSYYLRRSNAFWRHALKAISEAVKEENMETKQHGRAVCLALFRTAGSLVHLVKEPHDVSEERRAIAKVWAEEGLFECLDQTMDKLLQIPEVTMQLSRIFWCTESVVEQDPSILAAQFPRWKTLGSILAFDIDNQEKARAENRFTLPPSQSTGVVEGGAKIPEPNDHMWVLAAWEAFAVLQRRCKGTEQCMRRGCTNEGIKKCGICKEVKYCGEECQKIDWKQGHKRMCTKGWMELTKVTPVEVREPEGAETEQVLLTQRNLGLFAAFLVLLLSMGTYWFIFA